MRTNCLHPIEPLSIYRRLSRHSLRVNKDSNLLGHVLSECSQCSPMRVSQLHGYCDDYIVHKTLLRAHFGTLVLILQTQVGLIEFNTAEKVLIGSYKLRLAVATGQLMQCANPLSKTRM